MKLYTTPTSPYGRLVKTAIAAKGLDQRVEILDARTRTPNSPYYTINASGRVPFLVRDDGVGMEDSQLIIAYLDQLDGKPSLMPAFSTENWAYGRLETYARSMLDGISVHLREMRRPANERSPTILDHENSRAQRLATFWEGEIDHCLMHGPLNVAQILLVIALDTAIPAKIGMLEKDKPKLTAWATKIRALPPVQAAATKT